MQRLLGFVSVLAALSLPAAARAEAPPSDPQAVAIADHVMDALGGKQKWDSLVGIRWTFGASTHDTVFASRRHAWDKMTGWHRVEGKTRAGQPFVIVHKLNTDEGKAWVNGNAIEGDSLKKLIKSATSMWINDTYWMLMPYKLRDPGVTLKDDGTADYAGKTYDKLALSFDHVGQTPGDRYWVYVDPKTYRVERWEMILQSDPPAGPPTAFTWEGWQEHDGLWFPTAHMKGAQNVFTRDIETVKSFPPGTFDAP